jgi:hypothetical protein
MKPLIGLAAGSGVSVALSFLLVPNHWTVVAYGLFVLFAALYLPYSLEWTPDKELIDLIYYTSAALIAVAIYISAEFDRYGVSTQRQLAALNDEVKNLRQREKDLNYLSDHREEITQAANTRLVESKRYLWVSMQQSCADSASAESSSGARVGGGIENYVDKFDRDRKKAECDRRKYTLLRVSHVEKQTEAPLEKMTKVAHEMYSPGVVPEEKLEIVVGGNRYTVREVLSFLAENPLTLAATVAATRDEINRKEIEQDGVQAFQRKHAVEGVQTDVILTNDFVRTTWPYILILLLGLKISRVPYIANFMKGRTVRKAGVPSDPTT